MCKTLVSVEFSKQLDQHYQCFMHSSACNASFQKNSRSRLFQSLYWRTPVASPPGEDIIVIRFTSRSVCILYMAIVVDTGTVFVLDAQCSKGTQQHSSYV